MKPVSSPAHARRAANVASILADTGNVAIVALVSPMAADRAYARELHEQADLRFLEAWVDTPLEVCERRDSKGVYAKARRGEITGFTGIDDPYETPESPEITLDTVVTGPDQNARRVLEYLERQGFVR